MKKNKNKKSNARKELRTRNEFMETELPQIKNLNLIVIGQDRQEMSVWLQTTNLIRKEIKLEEIKLNCIDNKEKKFTVIKMFIDEGMIINKPVLDIIGEELMCSICNGLLYDPISCSNCETCFCKHCIENWILKNNHNQYIE